jgi:hypothetical protein
MTGKKWFLAVAAAAFLGWMAYLGYAVAVHRLNPPDVVSRSQLTAAESVVVVEVTADGGKPARTAKVVKRLDRNEPRPGGPEAGATVLVTNLPEAATPSNQPLATPGEYLVALVPAGPGAYRIAGWPRGLGDSTTQPGTEVTQFVEEKDEKGETRLVPKSYDPPRHVRPPLAYPWTDAVRKQMAALGYQSRGGGG